MTKYSVASRRGAKGPEKEVHPIWRGVGCFMMLFIPFLSWFLATLTMQAAVDGGWPVPYQLMGYPTMPPDMLRVPVLSSIGFFLQAQQNLYGVVLLTILYIVIIGALLSAIYSVAWKFVGPSPYGPLDAPPPKVTTKRYKR